MKNIFIILFFIFGVFCANAKDIKSQQILKCCSENALIEEKAKCFIERLFVVIDATLKANDKKKFVNKISLLTDYNYLTNKILKPFFLERQDILKNKQQYEELKNLVRLMIEMNYIAKAFNVNVEYRVQSISKINENFAIVKIFAKIPDGRVFDLEYTLECLQEAKDCECKIKDLSVEGIKVSEVYLDDIITFVENSNPGFEEMSNYLKRFLKKT